MYEIKCLSINKMLLCINYYISSYYLAVADLANCTIIGLSFKIKPLVSFNACKAFSTDGNVTNA